jgi:hypothetical protein
LTRDGRFLAERPTSSPSRRFAAAPRSGSGVSYTEYFYYDVLNGMTGVAL